MSVGNKREKWTEKGEFTGVGGDGEGLYQP